MGENRDTNAPIRVLLADDHAMFCQGIAGILASYGDLEVVAEVPNDEEALRLAAPGCAWLRLARELNPDDVVVMQVQMPFERSLETLWALRSFPPPQGVDSRW